MTVQELIDELMQVSHKEYEVVIDLDELWRYPKAVSIFTRKDKLFIKGDGKEDECR